MISNFNKNKIVFFNSLQYNDNYNYELLGDITLICKYTKNNHFLILKNKFGLIISLSCGIIEKSTTRKKRAYSTFLDLLNRLVLLCKKKKIILINYVYLYQKPRFLTWAVRRKLNSLSYLFYNNNIRIEQFKIIFVTPHHSGKKKKKIRRK